MEVRAETTRQQKSLNLAAVNLRDFQPILWCQEKPRVMRGGGGR